MDEYRDYKRLSVNMTENLHQEIKIRAAKRNITITEWIMRAIAEAMVKEDQYN